MKFLHVIPPSQRMMSGFMVMMQRYFMNSSEDTHKFIVFSEVFAADSGLLLFENVVNFPDMGKGKIRKFKYIRNAFEEADRIVFHAFQPDDKWLLLCYLLKDYMDKAAWVIWGIDLYNYRIKSNRLSAKIKNKMGEELRRRMRFPVAISEADLAVYNGVFGTHPIVCAAYPFMDTRFEQLDTYSKDRARRIKKYYDLVEAGEVDPDEPLLITPTGLAPNDYDGRIRVLVGHNAYPFNNHVASINMLARFLEDPKATKLEFCMPLNYGKTNLSDNVGYADAIKQYASTLKVPFHVSFLDRLLTANEYTRYLTSIDIAVFNAERQSGLGNILQLLYMGKKIYMTKKNPLFPFLRGKGFIIHDMEELQTISYDEFVKPDPFDGPNPWIKETRSIENVAKAWVNVFAYLKGEITAEDALQKNLKYLGN